MDTLEAAVRIIESYNARLVTGNKWEFLYTDMQAFERRTYWRACNFLAGEFGMTGDLPAPSMSKDDGMRVVVK